MDGVRSKGEGGGESLWRADKFPSPVRDDPSSVTPRILKQFYLPHQVGWWSMEEGD